MSVVVQQAFDALIDRALDHATELEPMLGQLGGENKSADRLARMAIAVCALDTAMDEIRGLLAGGLQR